VITSSTLKRAHAPRKQRAKQKRLERPSSTADPDIVPCYDAGSPLEPEFDVGSLADGVTQELALYSHASCSIPDVSCTHLLGQFPVFVPEETEPDSDLTPCDSVSSLLNLSPSMSTPTLSTSSSMSSTHSSPSEMVDTRPRALPLSSEERKAHYAWLDGIIGPASGIQESMGTYKAFMERQRDVYYDRLGQMAEQSTKVAPSRATNEFLSWLGSAPASQVDISPRQLIPSLVNAPQLDIKPTAPVSTLSVCNSSPGPSQTGCANTDACRYSRNQLLRFTLSMPQNVRLSARLPCSITDWTRHSRRQTFSATADM
jgi:hypothetical protein